MRAGYASLEPGETREYDRLARWISDDLADIRDPELTCELDGLLAGVERSACGGSVKQAFIDAFFARDRVRTALAEMVDPAAMLRWRLLHREPLPTLDALMMLAPDPRSRGQLERAAALTYAALDLHRSGSWGASPVLGITQVPGLEADRLVQARARGDLAVLTDGRPYLVSAAIDLSLDELMDALAWIQFDAAGRSPSRPLGALTSATRPTCHALRARLGEDPTNAEAIAAMEGAVLVLCLDGAPAGAPAPALEAAASGLFSTRTNRWYEGPWPQPERRAAVPADPRRARHLGRHDATDADAGRSADGRRWDARLDPRADARPGPASPGLAAPLDARRPAVLGIPRLHSAPGRPCRGMQAGTIPVPVVLAVDLGHRPTTGPPLSPHRRAPRQWIPRLPVPGDAGDGHHPSHHLDAQRAREHRLYGPPGGRGRSASSRSGPRSPRATSCRCRRPRTRTHSGRGAR